MPYGSAQEPPASQVFMSLHPVPVPEPLSTASSAMASPRNTQSNSAAASRRYETLVNLVAQEFAVDAKLLHAMVDVESGYDAAAVSPKGATGLMQVLPATGQRFGFDDLVDPYTNLRAGAAYLKWLLAEFDNNLELALAAYNAGEGTVYKYQGRIPPYRETQAFVSNVLERYRNASEPEHPRSAIKIKQTPTRAIPRLSVAEMLARLTGLLLSTPSPSSSEQ